MCFRSNERERVLENSNWQVRLHFSGERWRLLLLERVGRRVLWFEVPEPVGVGRWEQPEFPEDEVYDWLTLRNAFSIFEEVKGASVELATGFE